MTDEEAKRTLIYDLWRLWESYERLGFTEGIADYYERLSKEKNIGKTFSNTYFNTAENMRMCHRVFETLTWRRNKTKAVTRINLCRNKFCANCVKLIQATRLKRMYNVITDSENSKYLYHAVFTVRSVRAEELNETMEYMNKAFSMLVRYLNGTKKVRGIDFTRYGFYAAVKSIECTYKKAGWYHPHFHVIFAFNEPFPVEGDIENAFSFSESNGHRTFSEDVVFMQKLWRLLYDNQRARTDKFRDLIAKNLYFIPEENFEDLRNLGPDKVRNKKTGKTYKLDNNKNVKAERVTLRKIEELDCGYSVIFDRVSDGSYYEIFKYAFKSMSEDKEMMTYEQFKTLRSAFYCRQTIQTYGQWRKVQLDDDIDEDIADEYKRYVAELNRSESPEYRVERIFDVLKSGEEYGYEIISSSSLNKYLPAVGRLSKDERIALDKRFYERNPEGERRKEKIRQLRIRGKIK